MSLFDNDNNFFEQLSIRKWLLLIQLVKGRANIKNTSYQFSAYFLKRKFSKEEATETKLLKYAVFYDE